VNDGRERRGLFTTSPVFFIGGIAALSFLFWSVHFFPRTKGRAHRRIAHPEPPPPDPDPFDLSPLCSPNFPPFLPCSTADANPSESGFSFLGNRLPGLTSGYLFSECFSGEGSELCVVLRLSPSHRPPIKRTVMEVTLSPSLRLVFSSLRFRPSQSMALISVVALSKVRSLVRTAFFRLPPA